MLSFRCFVFSLLFLLALLVTAEAKLRGLRPLGSRVKRQLCAPSDNACGIICCISQGSPVQSPAPQYGYAGYGTSSSQFQQQQGFPPPTMQQATNYPVNQMPSPQCTCTPTQQDACCFLIQPSSALSQHSQQPNTLPSAQPQAPYYGAPPAASIPCSCITSMEYSFYRLTAH